MVVQILEDKRVIMCLCGCWKGSMSIDLTARAIFGGSFIELTGAGTWQILCSNLENLLS